MHIAVALSGGVDSLMSLILLRETGARIMAVHARFLTAGDDSLADRLGNLCTDLGVPFHLVDLRLEFEERVVTPFIQAYQRGLTPNPCAACNPAMKFGLLMDRVLDLGADRLATGHYVRLEQTAEGPTLYRGLDPTKDQSYFLSRVPLARFALTLFPLAGWTKVKVRQALAARGLTPPADQESQEICFINTNYREFLQQRKVLLSGPGPIALADGTVLGRHAGLWNHSLGQRKGLGVAYSEPLYVTGKDVPTNTLVVGPRPEALSTGCRTDAPNLLAKPGTWPAQVLVQTIYRQQPEPAAIELDDDGMTITFARPRPLPAPGQVAAVYAPDGQILAGATILNGIHHET